MIVIDPQELCSEVNFTPAKEKFDGISTTLNIVTSHPSNIAPSYCKYVAPLVVFHHLRVDIARPVRLVVWIL